MLCCGYTLTDFPISIRLTSLALWQSDDCPSASKATLMNMDRYFIWIHYKRLHNHNKAKHNKTVCIFLGIYCMSYEWSRLLSLCADFIFSGWPVSVERLRWTIKHIMAFTCTWAKTPKYLPTLLHYWPRTTKANAASCMLFGLGLNWSLGTRFSYQIMFIYHTVEGGYFG